MELTASDTEIVAINKKHYEEAIHDAVALKLIGKYLDECEMNDEKPDIQWIRHLME